MGATWLEAESSLADEASEVPGRYCYTEDVRGRMMEIHKGQLLWRAEALEAAWASTKVELRATLAFFAEPGSHTEDAAEQLLRTVDEFRCDMLSATSEVAAQP